MDKIIKLSSKQGQFDAGAGATKLLCDFTIPSGEVYNLRDSYVNVNLKINTFDTTETPNLPDQSGGKGVAMCGLNILSGNTSNLLLPNVCLVKNAFMSSQNKGKIDDVRRCDMLKNILYSYEHDLHDREDESYYSLSGTKMETGINRTPFMREVKEGSELSSQENHNVKIRLGEIFDICNEPLYDGNNYGDTEIHLELNLDKLRVTQYLHSTDPFWVKTPEGQANASQEIEDIDYVAPAGGGNMPTFQVTAKNTYSTLEFKKTSPWYVGQKLTFAFTDHLNANFTGRERIVTGINYDNTTGKVTMTLDEQLYIGGLPNAGTTKIENIVATGTDITANSTIDVNKIELVLQVVNNPSNVPSQLSYYTYSLEEDNYSGRDTNSKNYHIDDNCANVYVGFGSDILSSLDGGGNFIENYRITQDNIDKYGRNIEYNRPLHFDVVSQVYLNNGRKLKRILNELFETDQENENNLVDVDKLAFPVNERTDNQQSILGLEVNTTVGQGGINNIRIYQEKIATI